MKTPFALRRAPLVGSQRRDPRGAVRSFASIFGATLLCAVSTLGCASSDGLIKESCLDGVCFLAPKEKSEVKRLSSSEEREIVNRATLASTERKSPWEPTESELAQARASGIDLKDFVWATQRPNGGVLFPKKLPGPGPVVVLEPTSIAAPIGTEIVLVASFVGEDSTYMRVGEKIEWSLNGVGTFLAANPDDRSCCLDLTGKSEKRVDDRYLTTETTDKLWRIHRGTETPLDDVTILRGQTWTSVQSQEEGTSSVFVFSDSIDNWERRKASAEIHWIDAAFRFPQSQVLPIGSAATLETVVRRRSNLDPRPGWTVRYEAVSGDVCFGPNDSRVVDVPTDASGISAVEARQKNGSGEICRVSATVFRPASGDEKSIPVEKTTFVLSWTQQAPVDVKLHLPAVVAVDSEFQATAVVANNSDFAQDVVLNVVLPSNVDFVSADAPPEKNENGRLVWRLPGVPSQTARSINLVLRRKTDAPIDAQAYLESQPSAAPSNGTPTQGTSVPAPSQPLGEIPPAVSPTPNAPAANGTTPPPLSPTPDSAPGADPASQPPALSGAFDVFPSNGVDAEIANAAAPTLETVAFRFPTAEADAKTPRFREVSANGDDESDGNAENNENNGKIGNALPPTAGVPFETLFALTTPGRADAETAETANAQEAEKDAGKERVVVKLVPRPGLDVLLPDGTRRADVAYPAAPLDELADVVYKVRLVADAPGPKALAFYAFRENGDLLASDVLPLNVAPSTQNAQNPESPSSAQSAESPQSAADAPTSRLSEETATVFARKSPVVERLSNGAVGPATDRARVGVPFVYRAVVRNFAPFALEPNEIDVALNLPPELAFATQPSTPPNASAASVQLEPNRRRAVFRLGKRLEPRSEFELNVDLAAEKSGDVELEFELLDASNGAFLGVARHPLSVDKLAQTAADTPSTPQ